jgi:phosphotransferase system HPr-like phosphotransfer protein
MDEHNEQTAGITATFRLRDERGLHCRVAALLAYRLRVEAPYAGITLRTPEGREADPKMPLQTIKLGARHSGVVLAEATGPDAAQALGIVRNIVEREHVTRAEVVDAIPAAVGGEIGTLRAWQQDALQAPQRRQDGEDLAEWKVPGGFLHELADDTAPWLKAAMEAAMEAAGSDDPGEIAIGPDGGPVSEW